MSKSSDLYDRGLKVMPGGCSRNTILRKPHPLYVEKGEGCYVTDIEGVKRVDFANNMCSLVHGHAHPEVVDAVSAQLSKGTAFTIGTEVEVQFAEHIVSRSDSFDKMRFVNSGTEAVMSCIKASRAFTGRSKIAKAEGAYHGLYDYAEVSQTSKPENWGDADSPSSVPVAYGTPKAALDDVIIIPFNDPERAIKILEENKDDIACVLLDVMPHRVGLITAEDAFIQAIYKWTRSNDSLLVFDEVITYRSNYGGAQEWYEGVTPDLTAMGKMIGGGFPVGALAGRADVMDTMDPLASKVLFPHSGTFSANPITMTAGLVSMEMFDQDAVLKLNKLADYARNSIRETINLADVPVSVSGAGSMYRIHMKENVPNTYREGYVTPAESALIKTLLDHMFDEGIMMINTCSGVLSTVMTEAEIDRLAQSALNSFRKMKNQF
ncbi:MAG: aspartate aminotransferase family protein [Emcibacteraceae bacterium]|nr:aspartate aminotransferase family protein [Emcibacteraceae bacterium]